MDQNPNFIQVLEERKESVDEFIKRVMGVLRMCQKYSNELQGWENYADYSAVYSSMMKVNSIINNLVNNIFSHQDIKLDVKGFGLIDQFEIIREGNDTLFERINIDLDEAMGIRRTSDTDIVDTTVRTIRGPIQNNNQGCEVILRASRNVQKPQLFFEPKINNSRKEPFIPRITEKPNSMKPLSIMICIDSDEREYYSHPYEYELLHFNVPEEFLEKVEPTKPLPLSNTRYLYVENESTLRTMVDELKKAKEIAVDLENHSFRSYQGLTSLVQISTRNKDYIIDPFPLRNHLSVLNEVFTDPKIVKVFHGADYDILWLQRDCGVYVVNMFDTHQAAIVLEYPHRSLANLLHLLCSVSANKNYQRVDWRIRPLPEDFLEYARQDSHYLLYIYDVMKNELIEKGNHLNNLLHATYNRSTELCLKRYEKPIVGPSSHMDLYRRSRKVFNPRQLYALQKLYLWRDETARRHDESVDYVLPKHMMLQIAEVLPKEVQGILACCNPIPTLVKTEKFTIHQIIRSARDLPLDELNVDETQLKPSSLNRIMESTDVQSSAMSKHDLSLVEDDPKGLSTIINPQETLLGDLFNLNRVNVQMKRKSSLFGISKNSLCCDRSRLRRRTEEFMSPFERYQIFLKFIKDNEISTDESALKTEAPTIEMRIEKVKEHLLSLNKHLTKTQESKNEHESSSSSSDDSDGGNQDGTKNSDDLRRFERLKAHIDSLTTPYPTPKAGPKKKNKNKRLSVMEKNSKKRKSGENHDELKKKLKGSEAEKSEMGEMAESDVTPYDYSSANLSIFEPKKNFSKFGNRQGVKQKFKGKGTKKPFGRRKPQGKSMSWGPSGTSN